LWRGVAAATEHEDADLGADFRTVLDVGASRGQFALFAQQEWPDATIVCFEPLADPAAKLRRLLQGRVSIHQVALGSAPSILEMNVSGRDDSSSLLPLGRQIDEYPATAVTTSSVVSVDILDNYFEPATPTPVLLKIDVQGYELEVLKGAKSSLDLVGEILCECSFVELYSGQPLASDIVVFLKSAGFELAGVSGISRSRSGGQLQADLLFRRQSSS